MDNNFDYIIIGAGSAGCLLANRLTASGHYRVLLLEAGPENDSIWVRMPGGIIQLWENPKVAWMPKTVASEKFGNRSIVLTQGKMLGGSSALNGHVYTCGNRKNYDDWAVAGCTGWSYEEVLPYFKKLECCPEGDSSVHGHTGELKTTKFTDLDSLTKDFLKAAHKNGIPFSPDTANSNQEGLGYTHATIYQGVRQSSYEAFLKPAMKRSSLKVKTKALVKRIVFEGKKAIGVELETETIHCTKEVILSAGTIFSPQILQRSGIGDSSHLKSLGIAVVHASPEVGKNLQDHLFAHLKFGLKDPKSGLNHVLANPIKAAGQVLKWMFTKKGIMAWPASTILGFLRTDESLSYPDVQMSMQPFYFEVSPKNGKLILPKTAGFTVSAFNVTPKSRGEVRIKSRNPLDKADLNMNYLDDSEDMVRLTKHLRRLREIVREEPIAKYGVTELKPGSSAQSDEELEEYIRNTSETIYHPVGTCHMGADESAVLDPQLRVRGVEGLRVIDASIMPTITTGNTNAPTYMIAEKGADMVLADA